MRRVLLIAVASAMVCVGCEKKSETTGPAKDAPKRVLKPDQPMPAPGR